MVFFLFNLIGIANHYILFDQIVINKAILSKDKLLEESQLSQEVAEATKNLKNLGMHSKQFTYIEIMKFKFFPCCVKKGERSNQFKLVNKIIEERMDVSSVVNNSGNITLLSNVLMDIYQMKIISHFKRGAEDETKIARKMPITEALNQLFLNLKEKKWDRIHRNIDLFLLSQVEDDKEKLDAIKKKYELGEYEKVNSET